MKKHVAWVIRHRKGLGIVCLMVCIVGMAWFVMRRIHRRRMRQLACNAHFAPTLPPSRPIATVAPPLTAVTMDATFDGHAFRPDSPPPSPLPESQPGQIYSVRVTVLDDVDNNKVAAHHHRRPMETPQGRRDRWVRRLMHTCRAALGRPVAKSGWLALFSWGHLILLSAVLLVYAATRFIGLTHYPIYFFCDEATHAVLAQKLIANGLRDHTGTFLPPYFLNVRKWNLGLSIYLHAITVGLFGKSVFLTRATSVVVGLLNPIAIALTLFIVFRNRFWWMGPLVVGMIPAWFLHSRTAFETVMSVAFYSVFLCSYLLYRTRSPKYLFIALPAGAATFYSYSNGQGVMAVSSVLLLLFDFPYHLRQMRQRPLLMVGGVLLVGLLAIPLFRYRALHPGETTKQLRDFGSYWVQSIPVMQKLSLFAKNYLAGLDPRYWFLPNDIDLVRHRMQGSHIPLFLAPFILVGLGNCLWHWRSPAHRTVLVAILAVPFSPALVRIEVYRVLGMVIPATLLTLIGLGQLDEWVNQWSWLRRWPLSAAIGIAGGLILVLLNFHLVYAALTDGPTWHRDYGMIGMQYGARQLFEQVVPQILEASPPNTQIFISHTWANYPDVFLEFFLTPQQRARVQLLSIEDILHRLATARVPLTPERLFILPPDEYLRAVSSNKLVVSKPEYIIPYPDGRPGFYAVRLRYVDGIDAIVAAERLARQQLITTTVQLDGQPITVRHSRLDMGSPQDIFDANPKTLMRGLEANPFIVEFLFPSPRTITTLGLHVRCQNFTVKMIVTPPEGGDKKTYVTSYHDMPLDPRVDYTFPDGPVEVEALRIEITNTDAGESDHMHLWEVEFR